MQKERVAEILLDMDAVSINPANPFKYATGIFSPIYTDCRVMTSYPKKRKVIIDFLVDYIDQKIGRENIDVIVGTAHSGISLATYIAQQLQMPMAYIRTTKKDHGKKRQIEGLLKKGDKVLLICDIFSARMDVAISVEALKKLNTKIVYCLAIFTDHLNYIENFLEKEKIKYHTLTDIETLLLVATIKKKISEDERKKVEEWMKNPKNWDKIRKTEIEKKFAQNKEEVAEILLKIKAVTLNLKEPYRFTSGILSPIYTDNRLLMSYPNEWKKIIDSMIYTIINKIGIQKVDVIAGTATAGISHAAYLADKLGLPMIYVKSDLDEYGKFTRIEGRLQRGDRVLIIEDLISTGGSSLSSAEAIRESRGTVKHILSIFTYEMEKAKKNFEDVKITLTSLTDLSTLVDVAAKKKYIKSNEKKIILEWAKDPAGWEEKYKKMMK
jgi:orotate phosphoribosyltransferase